MTRARRATLCCLLFVTLCAAFLGNGFRVQNITQDVTGNLLVPVVLLSTGKLRFTPQDAPALFRFEGVGRLRVLGDPRDPQSAAAALASGRLRVLGPHYNAVPTRYPGVYANTFGVAAGLSALPVFAAAHLRFGDLREQPPLWFRCGKVAGALLCAGAAVLLFLAGLRLGRPRDALLAAGVFGLGTCVFSISSQSLWQHGPDTFFLALGAYGLLSGRSALCGLALGCAAACRPPSALMLLAVGLWHLAGARDAAGRRALIGLVLGALPPLALQAAYNTFYFGAPWAAGQMLSSVESQVREQGNGALFRTPLHEGAAGLLLSPGRGLFTYSPVLLLSLLGAAQVLRRGAAAVLTPLRPLLLGTLLLWLLAFKWYDWWGGVCYGYRPLVDTMPVLALCLIPALPVYEARGRGVGRALLGLLIGWSVLVQVAGTYVAAPLRWNFRQEGPRVLAIHEPAERGRLWSIPDNPIFDNLEQLFGAAPSP